MEIENNTINKTIKWFKDISSKNELKKVTSYEGISLLYFRRSILCTLLYSCLKNKKARNVSDYNHFILKFIENHKFISKPIITYLMIVRFILGGILNKSTKNKQPENSSTYKILAVSYVGYWKYYPTPQKESKAVDRDATLGGVLMALKHKNFNVVAIYKDSPVFVDFKTILEKRIQGKELWRPVDFYLTWDIIRRVFKTTKKYEEEWNKLKNNNKFIDSLNYEGIQKAEFLKDYFDNFFTNKTFLQILYIELIRRAIEVEKPDLILLSCIECPFGSAAVIAGKLKGVQTLDIQHGVINPYHFGYIQAKDEIAHGDDITPCCPIPDKTAVYGHYHKELLTEMSIYPEGNVVVTGSPRYDILYHADKVYCKEKFLSKYKINSNHNIILWTTQCHGLTNDENIKNFKAVFRTMQNLKDVTLVIKQHPIEEKIYTKMIKGYLNKYGIDAVIPPKSSDTYEQLFICDLMITRHSTTAMEAVALNKPVIILNLSGEPDAVDYVEQGVALGVYKEEDLKTAIEKSLKDDSELAKNRAKYIEKYLYKVDGKATERVVNVIEEMIEESKRKKGLK